MNYRLTSTGHWVLLSLFFAWGLTAVTVRMTVPHFKDAFDLGYRDALLVQSAFFLTYLLLARLTGSIVARLGLTSAVTLGLLLMATGSLGLAITTLSGVFWALLPSVFVIASGVTFLQVAANPLAAVEGRLRNSAGNLTFAQAFNSLGTVAAPLLAGAAFLGQSENPLEPIRWLFLFGAVSLALLGGLALRYLREDRTTQSPRPPEPLVTFGRFERWRLMAAAAAIFLYVGAEVSISSTLVNLLESEHIADFGRTGSALLTSVFWIGMLAGRLAGVWMLSMISRQIVLCGAALICTLFCALAASLSGSGAAFAILATGLFAGLQFPTIFAIATADLEPDARAKAAGWLCTAIVGGGVVPLLYGDIADRYGIETALWLPAACFLPVALFALFFGKERAQHATA